MQFLKSRRLLALIAMASIGLAFIGYSHFEFQRDTTIAKDLDSRWQKNTSRLETRLNELYDPTLASIIAESAAIRNEWNRQQRATTLTSLFFALSMGILLIAFIPGFSFIARKVQEHFEMQVAHERENQAMAFHTAKLRSLAEVIAGVAHEINNPLSIIEGYSHRIRNLADKRVTDEELKSELMKLHDKLNNSTGRIAKVIEQMRLAARDGNDDPMKTVSIKELLNISISHYRQKLHNNCVEFSEPSPDTSLELECRPTQVGQAIANLVYNSKHAVDQMEEKWIRIEAKDCGDSIELSVTDSGGGIRPELQDKIMQPFFTTAKVGHGSGLGLSVAKGIFESHGGTLSLDKSCNRTRFVVTLPKNQNKKALTEVKGEAKDSSQETPKAAA